MKTEDIQALAAAAAKSIKSEKDLQDFKKMLTGKGVWIDKGDATLFVKHLLLSSNAKIIQNSFCGCAASCDPAGQPAGRHFFK